MSAKKMGRPPAENPLSEKLQLRVDKSTMQALDECAGKLDTTRSEVVRKGVNLLLETLKDK